MEILGNTLAVIAALMLAVCVGLFIQPFASFWGARFPNAKPVPGTHALGSAPNRREIYIKIAVWMLLTRALVYVAGYILHSAVFGAEGTLFSSMEEIWSRTDAPHYLDIARFGYQPSGEDAVFLVFFPLYPYLVHVGLVLLGDVFVSGLLLSNAAAVLAALALYELASLDMHWDAAMRAVKYAFIMPSAFFYSATLSESLFLLLCLLCMLAIRKKRWFLGGLLGGLAALTRSLGVLLAVAVAVEWVHEARLRFRDWRTWLNALYILLIPMGFGVYLLVNYLVSGNPLQFLIYQREHWSQEFGSFFASIRTIAEMALHDAHQSPDMTFALWIPQLIGIFAALALMIAMARRLRPSYTAFSIAYFVVAIAPTWLLSAPRYLLTLFPLAMVLGVMTEKRLPDILLTSVMALGFLAFMTAYLGGMPIF